MAFLHSNFQYVLTAPMINTLPQASSRASNKVPGTWYVCHYCLINDLYNLSTIFLTLFPTALQHEPFGLLATSQTCVKIRNPLSSQPEILSHLFLNWCPSPVLLPFKKPFLPSFFEVLWHRSLYPPQLLLQYWIHKRYVIRNDLSVNTNI